MRYKEAKELHNEDKLVTVISTESNDKNVWIYAMTCDEGYTSLYHTEIS
jgi:hypothetical protein